MLIATRNANKLDEILSIFSLSGLELVSIDDLGELPEVEEDGETFEANAVKKAVTLALSSHLWTMSDDSGLEVDALGGKPGVYSARYAGEPSDHEANNRKLLREMEGVANRHAGFRCAIALSSPSGRVRAVVGRCRGRIAGALAGDGGFGYDPLFIPDGYEQTFAEMDSSLKNRISHRGAALKLAREAWGALLGTGGCCL